MLQSKDAYGNCVSKLWIDLFKIAGSLALKALTPVGNVIAAVQLAFLGAEAASNLQFIYETFLEHTTADMKHWFDQTDHFDLFDELFEALNGYVSENSEITDIYVTGHSLGAAMAEALLGILSFDGTNFNGSNDNPDLQNLVEFRNNFTALTALTAHGSAFASPGYQGQVVTDSSDISLFWNASDVIRAAALVTGNIGDENFLGTSGQGESTLPTSVAAHNMELYRQIIEFAVEEGAFFEGDSVLDYRYDNIIVAHDINSELLMIENVADEVFLLRDYHVGEGANALTGGSNTSDILLGGEGADTLYWSGGVDLLMGGQGDDDYYFYQNPELFEDARRNIITISEVGSATSGMNTIVFLGFGLDAISKVRVGDDLRLVIDTSVLPGFLRSFNVIEYTVIIVDFFSNINAQIERILTFDNGVEEERDPVAWAMSDANEYNDRIDTNVVGDQTYDGGDGQYTADYSGDTQGVNISLADSGDSTATGTGIGNDTLRNFENIYSGSGDDTINGNGQANVIYAAAGDDTVYGRGGDDVVIMGAGGGTDLYDGGAGIDTGHFLSTSAGIIVDLAAGTATGSEIGTDTLVSIENIIAGYGDDQITGDAADNVLFGVGGNDVLSGMAGDDIIDGGAGDDMINGGAGADTLFGGDGHDTVVFDDAGRVVVRLNNQTVSTDDTIAGFENAITGAGNDALIGSDVANILVSGAGDDYIDGLAGNDMLSGGAGNDRLFGRDGDDTLLGGSGDDILDGGDGNDTVVFDEAGRVVVRLNNQTVNTGDTIAGLENATTGAGNDALIGSNTANILTAGAGDDYVDALGGNDTLNGGSGNDRLFGGDGDDTLDGGAGTDLMLGGAGDDTIYFDANDTRLDNDQAIDLGGSGRDTLIIVDGATFATNGLSVYGFEVFRGSTGNDSVRGNLSNTNYDIEGGGGIDRLTV